MKKIVSILVFFLCCLSINAQTISYTDFQNIVNSNNLNEIIKTISRLGFNMQNVQEQKSGEKGLNTGGKSVYWSFNCDYDNYNDGWAIKSDVFWSYLRLVKINDINAIWDLTMNPKFCKEYLNKFEESLEANGFKSDVNLDEQANSITTFYEKINFPYLVSIKQTKNYYMISFFSTKVKF
jgi:hypothetical protein